jgi:NhaP-type Na+/H+ or K+/H+ antiporter
LEEGGNAANEDAGAGGDGANNNNNAAAADDFYTAADDTAKGDDDYIAGGNDLCSHFLESFLEGASDARDKCEGILNAYSAAECSIKDEDYSSAHYDHDDYFTTFSEHSCCSAVQAHYNEYCQEESLFSNFHLFLSAAVLLLCECAKALVYRMDIKFLPEAAVCIMVGTLVGLVAHLIPGQQSLDTISFDDELFLTLLLPPIIFEAALSVSKFEFKRRRGSILLFSVFGTVISTFTTGLMVHYMSRFSSATTFPMLDSLVFGALISSIDPVAILSVLTSLKLDQKDTVFILVFGESLLNDGIAITLFQTLVRRFDGRTQDGHTSVDEILDAIATFMISMFSSIAIGLACGCGAWFFFNILGTMLPPVMEVGSFFLWALIPYYICDAVHFSGIVSIVVVGFFMDIYIAGPKTDNHAEKTRTANAQPQDFHHPCQSSSSLGYEEMVETDDASKASRGGNSLLTVRSINPLPSTERIRLSPTADRHVRFVAHLASTLAENAIFAYLGLFLFSSYYDWNPMLISISLFSCVVSRAIMVVVVSYIIYHIYRCRGVGSTSGGGEKSSRTAVAIRNPRTQAVLVLAGLRGAVSLALVENVPIYNNVTGEGCEFKQIMKGMTSACILFTTFVFGGGAYYILPHLGIKQDGDLTSSDEWDNDVTTHRQNTSSAIPKTQSSDEDPINDSDITNDNSKALNYSGLLI